MAKKVELKTKETDASVRAFLRRVESPRRREDAFTVLEMMQAVTRHAPRMWGPSIVGFDRYHYTYASGHEGDICAIGFSPRKQALVLYLASDFPGRAGLLKRLGRHTTGVGCVYIKNLGDVDVKVLKQLMTDSYRHTKKQSG